MGAPKLHTSTTHRRCSKCQEIKEISQFSPRAPRTPHETNRINYECRQCNAKRTLVYYHSNTAYRERNALLRKMTRVRTAYGITYAEYLQKKRTQEHRCAICDRAVMLHLDHCHKTGKIRGFLCIHCNRMIGWANDDPEYLLRIAHYLEKHRD